MFRFLPAAGLVALTCLASPPALAQTPLDYVKADDYAAARRLLAREMKGRPDAPLHLAFLEAVILEHKGDFSAAALLYRQILSVAPHFEPAQRALAIVLARMGYQRAAVYEAERLAATTTDARLRAELQQDIAAMGGAKRGGVSFRFGILPSTNANHATSEEIVMIGGLPFILNPASRQASGLGLTYGATAWHSWFLSENWLAIGQLSYDHWVYNRSVIPRQSLASARLDFNGNLGRTAVSLGPRLDRTWQNGTRYRNRVGLDASASYNLTKKSALGLDLSYYRQVYPTANYLDGHLLSVTPSWSRQIGRTWAFGIGLPLSSETTRRDYLDHKDVGAELSLSHATPGGLHVGFDLSYSMSRYGGIYPGMEGNRRDKVAVAGIVISNDRIRLGKLVPEFSITRTVDMSNVSIQSYKSTDFGFSLAGRF